MDKGENEVERITALELMTLKFHESELAKLKAQVETAMARAEIKVAEFESYKTALWKTYNLLVGRDEITRGGVIQRGKE